MASHTVFAVAATVLLVVQVSSAPDNAPPKGQSSSEESQLESHQTINFHSAPETPWIESGGVLAVPRGLSSVIQLNGSFFIIGGCIDIACVGRSGAITVYDPVNEGIVPYAVANISLQFSIPSSSPVYPPTLEQATFAGSTAFVPVTESLMRDGVLNMATRPWLVGPCALYFANQGNSSATLVKELYHGVWGFSLDFATKEYYGFLPTNVPYRGNASCQAYGSRIFIVGGVLIDTLEIVSTIDAYDTITMRYIPNVQTHVEPMMNAALAIDNHMLYVVGGQTSEGCTSSSNYYLWTTGMSRVSRGLLKNPVHLCQSSKATAYYFSPLYILNESIPLQMFMLPDIPRDLITRNSNSSNSLHDVVEVVEMLKAFSFGGTLTISSFTSAAGTLSIEHLAPGTNAPGGIQSTPDLLAPNWRVQYVDGLEIQHASIMMYLIPYVFFGSGLALFSIGGVETQSNADNPIQQGATMTGQIYQRFVGLSMPALRGSPGVEIVDSFINISVFPPMLGFLRLSDNAACVGNTAGTMDEPINTTAASVSFLPLTPVDQVYACFSLGEVSIDAALPSIMFFSAINPFMPFAVLEHGDVIPTPSPSQQARRDHLLLAILLPVGAVAILAFAFMVRTIRLRHIAAANAEDPLLQEDPKDTLVRQTTSDSRYAIVRRVGEGAFSSVYLVCSKSDVNKTYAMKFMLCADDRERLEAIKECETINSVQAHPNVIQLMDMFMNYEFGGAHRGNPLDETDQAMLLTSSMHAIQIQHRKPAPPTAFPATPHERTSLINQAGQTPPSPHQHPRRSPTGLNATVSPTSVFAAHDDNGVSAVHTRYLCLVMQYHPAGDLCRYVLRRGEELQSQQRAAQNSSLTDSVADWFQSKKKSSGSSDEGPSSTPSTVGGGSFGYSSKHALSERQLLSIAYQIASVLQFLHAQRPPIVHRDLKPENILIKGPTPDPTDPFIPIVVTDFGLAFIQEEHRKSGRGGGTRPYISPESWKGQTTTASDVWSLGCVLYAMATQRLTSQTVRVMFQDAKLPNFTQIILSDLIRGHKYSCEFAVFVASILEADPKKRPTAEKLVRMFDVKSMPSPTEREDDQSGYITFKKDTFGPGGAASLIPAEILENGLYSSVRSD